VTAAPFPRLTRAETLLAPLAFVVLWSSAFIAARAGLLYASAILFLGLRFSIAASLLLIIILIWRQPGQWADLPFHHFVVSGVLINGIYLSGAYIALETISAATMALIGAFHPIVTTMLGARFLKEKIGTLQWLGLTIGLAGVILVVGPNSATEEEWRGLLFGAGGVLGLAVGTVYHRRFCRSLPIVPTNALQLSAAAVFCMLVAPVADGLEFTLSATLVVTLLYLAGVVSIGAMALLILMLRHGTAGQVASNFYLTPGITAVMGWLVLNERLDANGLVGLALASVGVWLTNRRQGIS